MTTIINSLYKFTEDKNKLFLIFADKQVPVGIKLSNDPKTAYILEAFTQDKAKHRWEIDPDSYRAWLKKVPRIENLSGNYSTIDQLATAILIPQSFSEKLKKLESSLLNPSWKPTPTPLIALLSEKQKTDLSTAIQFIRNSESQNNFFREKYRAGYSIQRGGTQWVITLAELPGQVFKLKLKKEFQTEEIQAIVNLFREGQELCQAKNLNHLYVPSTSALEFEGHQLVVQEKLDITGNGDAMFQRDLFTYISEHPQLRNLYDTILDELAQFIPLFQLVDVKWDNTPFIKNSQMLALYDLDRYDNAKEYLGIFKGIAADDSRNGLYSYIFDKTTLEKVHDRVFDSVDDKASYMTQWEIHSPKIIADTIKAKTKRELVHDFHFKQGIRSIEQPISDEEVEDDFQKTLIDAMNQDKETAISFDMIRGRKTHIDKETAESMVASADDLKAHLEALVQHKKIALYKIGEDKFVPKDEAEIEDEDDNKYKNIARITLYT